MILPQADVLRTQAVCAEHVRLRGLVDYGLPCGTLEQQPAARQAGSILCRLNSGAYRDAHARHPIRSSLQHAACARVTVLPCSLQQRTVLQATVTRL